MTHLFPSVYHEDCQCDGVLVICQRRLWLCDRVDFWQIRSGEMSQCLNSTINENNLRHPSAIPVPACLRGTLCTHTNMHTHKHAHTHTKRNTVDNLSYSGLPFMAESPVCDVAARWGRQLLDSILVWYQIGRPNIGTKTWFLRSDTAQGQRRKHKIPKPYKFMPNPNIYLASIHTLSLNQDFINHVLSRVPVFGPH